MIGISGEGSSAAAIQETIAQRPELGERLYRRAYVIAPGMLDPNAFPLNGRFGHTTVGCYELYVHKELPLNVSVRDHAMAFLIGHAYDPFGGIADEAVLLDGVLSRFRPEDPCRAFDTLASLTGVFVLGLVANGSAYVAQDCCGLMPVFYGVTEKGPALSSHCQLLADLYGICADDRTTRYTSSRAYNLGIRIMPGIRSPYCGVSLLTANTYLALPDLRVERFYPRAALPSVGRDPIDDICDVLRSSVRICSEKWRCAISLSGGIDSRMTLAASTDVSDRVEYFSFASTSAELRDANAAHELCSRLGLQHRLYLVPENPAQIHDYDAVKELVRHCTAGYLGQLDSDYRKIGYLGNTFTADIEIKSHVSEVGRAFYYKKLGKRRFSGALAPRDMSNLAKRIFFERRVLHEVDQAFDEFAATTGFGGFPTGYDETDMFYWEHRMGAWGALARQTFDVSHAITMVYNNRRLLEMFLSFPLDERIEDIPQRTIIERLNPKVAEFGFVSNRMEAWDRVMLERVFWEVNSRLP